MCLSKMKYFCSQFIGCRQKEMIINFYKSKMLEQANVPEKLKYDDLIKLISKEHALFRQLYLNTGEMALFLRLIRKNRDCPLPIKLMISTKNS